MTRILRPEQYGDEINALWDVVTAIKTAPLLNATQLQADQHGLIQVMQRIATGDAVQLATYVGPGAQDVTLVDPTSGTFTLTRPCHLLIMATMSGLTTGAVGQYAGGAVTNTNNSDQGVFGDWDKRNAGFIQQTAWRLTYVDTGTWSVKLSVHHDNGQTFTLAFGTFDVFQLGS